MHAKKRFPLYDLCFLTGFCAALFFLVWKCRYGYGACDEPFYLTLAQRLADGDALLSEEWNLSQLSGLLLLPFYQLYRLFFRTTEGIVLHFRYIYVFVQSFVCLLLYWKLRRFRFGGVLAALMFYLYTPYDIMALSYNTMGLMSMTLCVTFLVCREKSADAQLSQGRSTDRKNRFDLAVSGFFYALAVLCHPYVIALYLFFLIYCICIFMISLFIKHDSLKVQLRKRLSELLFFTIGAAVPAVLFLLFLFSRTSISALCANLTEILNDPDHSAQSPYSIVYGYFYAIFKGFGTYLSAWLLILVLAFIDRRRQKNAWMYFGMTALLTALAVLTRLPAIQTDYNFIMFPLSMCGLTAYLLTGRKNHSVFLGLWCTGILYTFCLHWSSNQGLYAICLGIPIASAAAVLLIRDFLLELRLNGRKYPAMLTVCLVCLLLSAQLVSQCYAKAVHAFWEPSVSSLNVRICDGPLKGLYTTAEHADAYNKRLADIPDYRNSQGPILFITSDPWCYLYADTEYGTYSSWISSMSTSDPASSMQRLEQRLGTYFSLHPDKIPVQIYIAKEDLWDDSVLSAQTSYIPFFTVSAASSTSSAYAVTETENGFHLVQISVN